MTTGWPPGLLQDDDRGLSRWLASRPDARYQLRRNMTTQPEALRLADALENTPNWQKEEWNSDWESSVMHFSREPFEAAAELRRLYALNQELLVALKDVAALKRRDPCKGRSNAGRWVALNATAELIEKVDVIVAKAEGRA